MDTNTATTSTNLVVQKNINGNTFETDKDAHFIKITWDGKVNVDVVSELLTLAGNLIEFEGYTKLLIDRSKLEEYDTEARMWIKDLLKTRAKKLAKNVQKLALINAKSSMGNIFGNMMATAISLMLPNMQMKKFDESDEAEKWILS